MNTKIKHLSIKGNTRSVLSILEYLRIPFPSTKLPMNNEIIVYELPIEL